MNYPQQAAGYRKTFMTIFPTLSPPNVFIGGPDPDSPSDYLFYLTQQAGGEPAAFTA